MEEGEASLVLQELPQFVFEHILFDVLVSTTYNLQDAVASLKQQFAKLRFVSRTFNKAFLNPQHFPLGVLTTNQHEIKPILGYLIVTLSRILNNQELGYLFAGNDFKVVRHVDICLPQNSLSKTQFEALRDASSLTGSITMSESDYGLYVEKTEPDLLPENLVFLTYQSKVRQKFQPMAEYEIDQFFLDITSKFPDISSNIFNLCGQARSIVSPDTFLRVLEEIPISERIFLVNDLTLIAAAGIYYHTDDYAYSFNREPKPCIDADLVKSLKESGRTPQIRHAFTNIILATCKGEALKSYTVNAFAKVHPSEREGFGGQLKKLGALKDIGLYDRISILQKVDFTEREELVTLLLSLSNVHSYVSFTTELAEVHQSERADLIEDLNRFAVAGIYYHTDDLAYSYNTEPEPCIDADLVKSLKEGFQTSEERHLFTDIVLANKSDQKIYNYQIKQWMKTGLDNLADHLRDAR